MSHTALSDDESDHKNGTNLGQSRYVIVQEAWRSDELIKWLRLIDLLACGEKWDGRNVARRGNVRHLRVHSTCSKEGVAVSGLPENCYNPHWLGSLKDYQRRSLNVQPAIDMTFSEEELSCVVLFLRPECCSYTMSCFSRRAAQYIPLTRGEARPSMSPDISGLDNWLIHMFGEARRRSESAEPE
jgi:hypothetical protein